MAEDTIRDKRTYDPSFEIPKKVSRRTLLKQAGVVVGAGVVSGIGLGALALRENAPEAPKSTLEILLEQGVMPTNIFLGEIKITKGKNGIMLNVRSAPNIGQDSSVSSWLNIEKFNGVDIKDVSEFLIKNALLVEGQFVDNPAGTKGEKGLWIVGNVDINTLGVKKEEPKYISYSSSTGELVTRLNGEFHKISQVEKSGITTTTGQKIPSSEIGLVIPQNK